MKKLNGITIFVGLAILMSGFDGAVGANGKFIAGSILIVGGVVAMNIFTALEEARKR
jgi:hypothetical protein